MKNYESEHVSYEELYEAYLDCRRRKRSTSNSLEFEMNENENLYKLWIELNDMTYQIGKSIVFVVDKPCLREVFAADFKDRIVHHLLINRLMPYFEEYFIQNSYSCRKNKGVLYGVKQCAQQMKEASDNFTEDVYVVKCDLKSFFMTINKDLLYKKLEDFITNIDIRDKFYNLWLIKLIVYNNPQENCIRKQNISHWKGLPKEKSLFFVPKNIGLPIGNLTSQIFANFFLCDLDFLLQHLYYGRYVDDFYFFIKSLNELPCILNEINYILSNLQIHLHPKKLYVQHYIKGVSFIGAVIKPNRIYISKRVKNFLHQSLQHPNTNSINSYFGMMIHYNTYKFRRKICTIHNLKSSADYRYIQSD